MQYLFLNFTDALKFQRYKYNYSRELNHLIDMTNIQSFADKFNDKNILKQVNDD